MKRRGFLGALAALFAAPAAALAGRRSGGGSGCRRFRGPVRDTGVIPMRPLQGSIEFAEDGRVVGAWVPGAPPFPCGPLAFRRNDLRRCWVARLPCGAEAEVSDQVLAEMGWTCGERGPRMAG